MKLPNSMNTLSISTSTEGKSWERRYCFFCYSMKSVVHSNQISNYITLLSSRNLFDVIFTKLNALRRRLLQTGTLGKEFSEAPTKRNLSKRCFYMNINLQLKIKNRDTHQASKHLTMPGTNLKLASAIFHYF